MANEVTTIGIGMETDGVERGIKSLKTLAEQGPKVEQAMAGVERVIKTTGRTLESLRQSAPDLSGVANGAAKAGAALGSLGGATRTAIKNSDDLRRAMEAMTATEEKYIRGLMEEARTIGLGSGARAAYIAQTRGMSESTQALARALGDKTEAMRDAQKGALSASDAFGVFRGALAAVASIGVAKQLATMADTMTNMESRLKLVTNGTEALSAAQSSLFSIAQNSRVRFADLADTYAQMARSTKELGVSQKDMLAVTQTISQAVTISGGSAASASAALVQLSQGFASGTLRGEELNSVMEQTPRLAQAIAQGLGVSIGELRKMGSEGELTAQKVVEALQKAAPAVAAEFAQMNVTISQSTTAAGNSLVNLTGTMDKLTGASSAAAHGVLGFSANLDALDAQIKTMAKTNSLSDFFLAAFNTDKSLNDELEISRKELEELKARLEKAPSNIYLRSATADAQALVDKLLEAQKRLKALSGVDPNAATGGIDIGALPSRGSHANYEKEFNTAQQALLGVTARNGGYTKQFTDDLKVYEQALKTGAMSASEYAAAITDLNKKRYESTEAGKAEAKASKAGASAVKQEEQTYASLIASIEAKIAANREELKYGRQLTESEKLRNQLTAQLASGAKKLTDADKERTMAALANLSASEQEKQYREAFIQNAAVERQLRLDAAAAMEREATSQLTGNKALRDEIELIGLSEDAQYAINRARLEAQITIKEQHLAEMQRANDVFGFMSREQIALEQQIELLRERLTLLNDKRVRTANKAAADQIAKDWDRTAQTIGDTLADYIMGGGKDAAQYLKRLFATLVLQPVVQYGVSGVMGALGMGGAGGTGSSIGGMFDLFSKGKSITGIFGGTSMANTVGAGYANLTGTGIDGLLATNGAYGTAGGVSGAAGSAFSSVLSFAPYAALIAAGMNMAGNAYDQGYRLNQKDYTKGWLATGGLAPPTLNMDTKILEKLGISGKVANMITGASLWAKGMEKLGLTTRGANHQGGAYSTTGNGVYDLGLRGDALGDFTSRGNAEIASSVQGLVQSTVSAFDYLGKYANDTFKGVDIAAGFAVNGRFSDEDAYAYFKLRDKATGGLLADYSQRDGGLGADANAAWSQFSSDVLNAVFTQFKQSDITGWVVDQLNTIDGSVTFENLSNVIQQIALIDAAFVSFGKTIDGMADLAGSVQTTLIRTSGGFDALSANLGSYYAGYYSAAEQLDDQVASLTDVFSAYGAALPTTREQFRALVEQQLAAGDAGAEFAAVLLGLNTQFGSVADAWAKDLSSMSASVSDFFSDLMASIDALYVDVESSRKDILRGNSVMSPAEIAASIASTGVRAPSVRGVDLASATERAASAEVARRQADLTAVNATKNYLEQRLQASYGVIAGVDSQIQAYTSDINERESNTSKRNRAAREYGTALIKQAREALYAERSRLEQEAQAIQSGLTSVAHTASNAANSLAIAQAALTQAEQGRISALADYAKATAAMAAEAATSVDKLSDLRGEVVSFYEAQAQAALAMLQSAGNIRGVVDQLRLGQLNTAQTAAELGSRYATDYSMALATTGSVRAGYVDSMASNLGSLSEALKAESVTSADWRIETAKLFAQASNAAGLLQGDAESDDYKDVALGLLDSIDAALAGLSNSTKSAEQVIADVIKQGTQAQLSGLRAIVAALKGEAIPAFATGGHHAGGLRIVGENGPELEATGPSRIWNAQQTAALFSGGGNTARLEALVATLIDENRAQASAMVRLQQDNNRLLMRWETQGMPEERSVM